MYKFMRYDLLQRQREDGVSPASSLLLDRMEQFLNMVGSKPSDSAMLNFNGTQIKCKCVVHSFESHNTLHLK